MTPDGKLVLSGGARGVVTLRWLHSLQVSNLHSNQRLFHSSFSEKGSQV